MEHPVVTRKVITIVFEDGEDIVEGFKNALKEQNVKVAEFETIQGKVRNFDLKIYVAGNFIKKHFDSEYTLCSISGRLSLKQDSVYHGDFAISLSKDADMKTMHGQPLSAIASGEVTIKAKCIE